MQSLVARQDVVNMIINQCQLEQGWNVRLNDFFSLSRLFVFKGVDTDRLSLVATYIGHAMSLLSVSIDFLIELVGDWDI